MVTSSATRAMPLAAAVAAVVLTGLLAVPRFVAPGVSLAAQSAQAVPASPAPLPAEDEFVGPFASWLDVTSLGAKGDGVADDSAALQAALDRLIADKDDRVVYLPAGTYRLTRTLTLRNVLGVSLLGDDPERTRLVWDGPVDGTMLVVNGLAYSRVGRLTFDGRGRAGIAVDQAWDGTRPHFDTGNAYEDDRFVDVKYGIRGGVLDKGFAETTVVRARFIRNRMAGIALGNFNALDLWVWSSLFEDCGVGITNDPGAGNYRVYGSVFRRSRTADLYMQNTGGFTARGNYSVGSRAFWLSGQAINHPSTLDIQDNTIVDPLDPLAIRIGNQGPGLLLDNRIRSLPRTAGPVVSWTSLFGADVVSVGNTYTVTGAVHANGRMYALDDRVVARDAIAAAEPALPSTWPRAMRRVYDVPRGADTATIQKAIDTAVRDGSPRPVVHLPAGAFTIERTLVVPPSDVQIVGDGAMTILDWRGGAGQSLIRLEAPSRATLRELRARGATAGEGIVVPGLDRPGGRVHLEGVQLTGALQSNLFLDRTGAARIQMVDIGHSGARGASIRAEGPGRSVIESGASSGTTLAYRVSGGASLLARDIWYEGPADDGFTHVSDGGRFTLQGARVATPAGHMPPAFIVDSSASRFVLLTTQFDDRIVVTGEQGAAMVLGVSNLRGESTMPGWSNNGRVPVIAQFLHMRQRVPRGGLVPRNTVPTPDVGPPQPDFLRTMLSEVRHVPVPSLAPLPEGSADVRLFRVWAEGSRVNLRLSGQP